MKKGRGIRVLLSIAVISSDGSFVPFDCPVQHELFVVKTSGWGKARTEAFCKANYDLIVMINGDVKIHAEFWGWLKTLRPGEFVFARQGSHVSSRIFAAHWVTLHRAGGFDSSIDYYFEDGDFYVRALNAGLVCRIVPEDCYEHHNHNPHFRDSLHFLKYSWEQCKMYVKYPLYVYRTPLLFFRNTVRKKRFFVDLPLKLVGLVYWLVRKELNLLE